MVTIVLAGLGGYGATYVDEILDRGLSNAKIVGLVEPYPDGCKRLPELLKLGAKLYKSLDDFYSEQTAELAVISTPIQFHTEHIITALEHGSNVLCEKPLCGDKNDIEKIISARNKATRFVDMGYQWSHNDGILQMKQDILSGLYGKPKLLKSITLWPRDEAYFNRGIGWAGKIHAPDGSLVYDSVANNATAHYLHNMFFVLGKEINTSLEPINTEAFLLRTQSIENFDSCVIRCQMPEGAKVLFVSSHGVEVKIGPVCEYVFENGTIRLSTLSDTAKCENDGHFVGYLNDGRVIDYGDPQAQAHKKLRLDIIAAESSSDDAICCPVEAAAVHTRLINYIQESFEIKDVSPKLIRTMLIEQNGITSKYTYAEGLFDALVAIYKGEDIDLNSFASK